MLRKLPTILTVIYLILAAQSIITIFTDDDVLDIVRDLLGNRLYVFHV